MDGFNTWVYEADDSYSRSFLSKGPSAARVENVEYETDIKGASDSEIRQALGSDTKGYEVR